MTTKIVYESALGIEDAGDVFKGLEEKFRRENSLDLAQWAIVRLDGHSFSKWVKRNYPTTKQNRWHSGFEQAMTQAALAMAKEYRPALVYTFSDEVSLVFSPATVGNLNGGRILKLCTLMSSMMTAKFIMASDTSREGDDDDLATFDARAYSVPTEEMVATNIVWRMTDARRNSVAHWARQYSSNKELNGMNSEELIRQSVNVKGALPWQSLPTERKAGRLFCQVREDVVLTQEELAAKRLENPKFGNYLKEQQDPLTGETVWSYPRRTYKEQTDVVEDFCGDNPKIFYQLNPKTIARIQGMMIPTGFHVAPQ
jgi:tRNA(His) 5'-end guanylyltransferase